MTIREFQIEDIHKGLLETYKEVWYIDLITEKTVDEWLKNNNYMFVVENNGEIIGSATLHVQKKFIRNGGLAGFIEDVVVRNEFRGKNIGSELIQKLIEKAKELGCYKIVLSCFPERINFYERNGFFQESVLMRLENKFLE